MKNIIGIRYINWDTHDLGFVNFLYFSDALRSGYLPFWNPLIQSGVFFPTFNNIGLYSPYQMLFVILSWIINPLHAFELMYQFVIFFGGMGAYLFFRSNTFRRDVSIFGAISYMLANCIPIMGQGAVVFSLSLFPWLLVAIYRFTSEKKYNVILTGFCGILAAFYASSGYPWFNIVNFAIVFIYMLLCFYQKQKIEKKKVFIIGSIFFVALFLLVLSSLMLPGYLNLKFQYLHLAGYVSPEPRLRGIHSVASTIYAYKYLIDLLALIDPRLVVTYIKLHAIPLWSVGAGWVVWMVFLLAVLFKIKFRIYEKFWMLVGLASLMYAYNPYGNHSFFTVFIRHIPIFNANRWWFFGAFYLNICVIFLATYGLNELLSKQYFQRSKIIFSKYLIISKGFLLYFALMALLVIVHANLNQYIIVSLSMICLLLFFSFSSNKKVIRLAVFFLIIVNIMAFFTLYHPVLSEKFTMPSNYVGHPSDFLRIKNRHIDVMVKKNDRRLGLKKYYIYNDIHWLLNKYPFTHGYDNLGNPLYWYVKDEPFLRKIVDINYAVRKEADINRKHYVLSDEYVHAIINDINKSLSTPTVSPFFHTFRYRHDIFNHGVKSILLTPDYLDAVVYVSAPAYVTFYNNYAPGWHVYINAVRASLVRVDHIFMGVYLRKAGKYTISFCFRPVLTYSCLILPYILLILFSVLLLIITFKNR